MLTKEQQQKLFDYILTFPEMVIDKITNDVPDAYNLWFVIEFYEKSGSGRIVSDLRKKELDYNTLMQFAPPIPYQKILVSWSWQHLTIIITNVNGTSFSFHMDGA